MEQCGLACRGQRTPCERNLPVLLPPQVKLRPGRAREALRIAYANRLAIAVILGTLLPLCEAQSLAEIFCDGSPSLSPSGCSGYGHSRRIECDRGPLAAVTPSRFPIGFVQGFPLSALVGPSQLPPYQNQVTNATPVPPIRLRSGRTAGQFRFRHFCFRWPYLPEPRACASPIGPGKLGDS